MTAGQVTTAIQEVQQTGDLILKAIEGVDPAVEVETETATGVLNLTADLVTKALAAWIAAAGEPITADSVMALMPNPTPLTPPTSV